MLDSAVTRDVFAALANPIRRKILIDLREGELGVSEIARRFEIRRPAVSEHLQVLRKVGLIREEQRGRERYYHLDPRPFREVNNWIDAFSHYWPKRLAALEALLDNEATKNDQRD